MGVGLPGGLASAGLLCKMGAATTVACCRVRSDERSGFVGSEARSPGPGSVGESCHCHCPERNASDW